MKLPERVFATVLEKKNHAGRSKLKLHTSLNFAKAALDERGGATRYDRELKDYSSTGGSIYEFVNGSWILLYVVPPGTPMSKLPWRL